MSRRREEAELQRVLLLSTQQAHKYALMSPHTLSSAPTDDSRDMELRPAGHCDALPTTYPNQIMLSPTQVSPPRLLQPPSYDVSSDEDSPTTEPMLVARVAHVPSQQHVEVLIERKFRGLSADPIDTLSQPSELFSSPVKDMASSIPVSNSPAISSYPLPAESSSAATRISARVKSNNDKKEAEKAERRRKRLLEKERQKHELEERERTGVAVAILPSNSKKRSSVTPARNVAGLNDLQQSPRREGSPAVTVLQISPSPVPSIPAKAAKKVKLPPKPKAEKGKKRKASLNPIDHPHRDKLPTPEILEQPQRSDLTANLLHKEPVTQQTTESEAMVQKQDRQPEPNAQPEQESELENEPSADDTLDTHTRTPLADMSNTPVRPGPPRQFKSSTPGIKWKAPRDDLSAVLAKFPGAKRSGMSKRLKIPSLHTKIGPMAKALPPPPPKPSKKVIEEEYSDEEDNGGKVKVGSREWLMMED